MLVYDVNSGRVAEEKLRQPEPHEVAWIRMTAPEPAELRRLLEQRLKCHPLLVEDAINMNQRPKLDRYKNHAFVTFFAVERKQIKEMEIALVIGANYVVSITKEDVPFLRDLEKEFMSIEGRMEHAGDILYHILDRCVDEYTSVTDEMENDIDRLERAIHRHPYVRVAREIFAQKRQMHRLRRIFDEERTVVGAISHQTLPFTRPERDLYFSDIHDHISRVADVIDMYRESLSGLLELQSSLKSDRMNEIMKTLTLISSIFLPLTFIAGIYGMNFEFMPELHWRHGYPGVILIMGVVAFLMWLYYKRKKWL